MISIWVVSAKGSGDVARRSPRLQDHLSRRCAFDTQPMRLTPPLLAVMLGRAPRAPSIARHNLHQRLDAAAANEEEAALVGRVNRCTAFNAAVAAGALTGTYCLNSQPAFQGWVAAAGAALVFGGSSLPSKHPAAANAGTLGFQLWVTIGNASLNLLLLLLLHVPIRWSAPGMLGAMTLTLTQLFAWPAIQRLGAAVGPGVWCGVGMVTSFTWGTTVFGESLHSPPLAAAALGALILGVGGVASSQFVAGRRTANVSETNDLEAVKPPAQLELSSTTANMEPESNSQRSQRASRSPARTVAVGTGIACAVATGVFDGSLMAPFSYYRAAADGVAVGNVALTYLGGFALAMPVVGTLPLLLTLGTREVWLASRGLPSERRRFLNLPCALTGVGSGALWAAANVLSVHATMRLGQAVGFPLTQVCVVVSSLWGILYFGELRDRLALTVFACASLLVLAGAAALKVSGLG